VGVAHALMQFAKWRCIGFAGRVLHPAGRRALHDGCRLKILIEVT